MQHACCLHDAPCMAGRDLHAPRMATWCNADIKEMVWYGNSWAECKAPPGPSLACDWHGCHPAVANSPAPTLSVHAGCPRALPSSCHCTRTTATGTCGPAPPSSCLRGTSPGTQTSHPATHTRSSPTAQASGERAHAAPTSHAGMQCATCSTTAHVSGLLGSPHKLFTGRVLLTRKRLSRQQLFPSCARPPLSCLLNVGPGVTMQRHALQGDKHIIPKTIH